MTSTNTDAGDVRTGFTKNKTKQKNQIKRFFLFLTVSLTLNTSQPRRLFLSESWGRAWVKPPLTTAAASSSHSSPLSPSPPRFLILVKKGCVKSGFHSMSVSQSQLKSSPALMLKTVLFPSAGTRWRTNLHAQDKFFTLIWKQISHLGFPSRMTLWSIPSAHLVSVWLELVDAGCSRTVFWLQQNRASCWKW